MLPLWVLAPFALACGGPPVFPPAEPAPTPDQLPPALLGEAVEPDHVLTLPASEWDHSEFGQGLASTGSAFVVAAPGSTVGGKWIGGIYHYSDWPPSRDWVISGTGVNPRFGRYLLASEADLNGDGIHDVATAGPGYDYWTGFEQAMYVFMSPFEDVVPGDEPTAIIEQDEAFQLDCWIDYHLPNHRRRPAVRLVDDLDGDGGGDLVLGPFIPRLQGSVGVVSVFNGGSLTGSLVPSDAGVTLQQGSGGLCDGFGYALDAGDLDGDGATDLVVAGINDWVEIDDVLTWGVGSVWMFRGPLSGDLTPADADASISGRVFEGYLGTALEVADFNGDGIDDLLAAEVELGPASHDVDIATLLLFYGPLIGPLSANDADASMPGLRVQPADGDRLGVGDFDGDGTADLVLRSRTANELLLFYGPITGTRGPETADATLVINEQVGFGQSSVAADLDGDGYDEVIAGAPTWAPADAGQGESYGAVLIWRGGPRSR